MPHTPAIATRRQAIITADDFGLSLGVNEAVEQACREGILTTASLMIAGPAAEDAIRRARRLPQLHVGLHVVLVDGPSIQPEAMRGLVDANGDFPPNQLGLAFQYVRPHAQKQLASEIRAQFAAFRQTGLRLDHANAHKHMQMHPTVGRLMIETGLESNLPALRIPFEPAAPLHRAGGSIGLGGRALNWWCRGLRRRAVRAGLRVNDAAFGIAWSGHMTADRLLRLIPNLPPGLNEIYLHPSARRDGAIPERMPTYEHEAELQALLDPAVRRALADANVDLTSWSGQPPD